MAHSGLGDSTVISITRMRGGGGSTSSMHSSLDSTLPLINREPLAKHCMMVSEIAACSNKRKHLLLGKIAVERVSEL